ncbi:MAG: sigma 54-interacting transcriptional regulator [Candidatus Hydrogenedentota bacterium]
MIQAPLNQELVGTSAKIQEVNELLQRLAQSDLMVLITGEMGTGKEIAAHKLHKLSPRSSKPFIKVNCPGIPETIFESELFGFEPGAFTGARTVKPGRFELAHKGSIFLDELSETPLRIQGKLLQVLEGEPIMRIGGVAPVHVDVRVIAATNLPLNHALEEGYLRKDIYFRISEMTVEMPPLRERVEDIPLLAEHFNYNYCTRQGKEYKPIPAKYIERMQAVPWRGNVRELGGQVKKYVTTGDATCLWSSELGEAQSPSPGETHETDERGAPPVAETVRHNGNGASKGRSFPSLKEAAREAMEHTERALIEEALQYTLWNRRKAAELLDISYSSLLRRIDAYNIGKDTYYE